jgi:hypothetical protein
VIVGKPTPRFVDDTFVAELTGLLDLGSWRKNLDPRIIVRDEPLHPRYRT